MNDSGDSPLFTAAWFGCDLAVGELVAAGADASHVDEDGRTASDLAVERGHEAVVAALKRPAPPRERPVPPTPAIPPVPRPRPKPDPGPETSRQTIELHGDTDDVARWIWNYLVPASGQADTVQGELLRAIENLRWEAQNNGNINWHSEFEERVEFLGEVLLADPCFSASAKAQIEADLARLTNFVSPSRIDECDGELPYVEDDLYDRLVECVVCFCRAHPVVIPRAVDPDLRR